MTGPEKWKLLMPIVLVCVYGTTSCPDDGDLSCERPWTAVIYRYIGHAIKEIQMNE